MLEFNPATGMVKIGKNIELTKYGNKYTITYYNTGSGTGPGSSSGSGSCLTIQITCNPDGLVTSIEDFNGKIISYEYDAQKCLSKVATKVENKVESETTFTYDPVRYLKDVKDSLGHVVAMTEYLNGRIWKVTDAAGNVTTYNFDVTQNQQTVIGPTGTTTIQLDGQGNILYEETPGGTKTFYTYKNNLPATKTVKTKNNNNDISLTTKYEYDGSGRLTKETDPQGNVTKNSYNEFGQLTATKRNGITVSSTQYSPETRLPITSTDANGNTTNYRYDGNNLTEIKSGNQTLVENRYNSSGQIEMTIANGRKTSFQYDAAGNCTETSYTELGKKISDSTEYDAMRRVIKRTRKVNDVLEWQSDTGYDSAGQVTSETNQYQTEVDKLTTRYRYDKCGRKVQTITQMMDSAGNKVDYFSENLYDAAGRITHTTENHTPENMPYFGTRTTYDADGRVTRTEHWKGMRLPVGTDGNVWISFLNTTGTMPQLAVNSTTYNTAGWVLRTVEQPGTDAAYTLETQYTYDNLGNVTQVKRQSPDETGTKKWLISQTLYDDLGRVLIATDTFLEGAALIYGTKTVYDEKGRVLKTVRLENVKLAIDVTNGKSTLTSEGTALHTSETRYDSAGRVAKTISPEGMTTSYEYDSLGRQTKTLTNSLQTVTAYDSMGRVAGVTVSDVANPTDKRTTSYLYDAYGNIVQTTNPDTKTIKATFNAQGQKVSETNQLNQTRTFEYDAQGRLTKVIMPACGTETLAQRTFTYAYNANGNQTSITDPLNHVTSFTYDPRGNQLTRTLPMNQVESCTYDNLGRQKTCTSFEGVVTDFVYDSFGRLSQKRFFPTATAYNNGTGTPTDTWTYKFDVFGREVESLAGVIKTVKTYDVQGRNLTSEQFNGATSVGKLTYEYDKFGRQSSAMSSATEKTTYTYDEQSRLKTVTDTRSSKTTAYEYDAFGNRSKQTVPSGFTTTYTYDKMNRLQVQETKTSAGALISQMTYQYTNLGQKSSVTEKHGTNTITTTWKYDDRGRATEENLVHYTSTLSQKLNWEYVTGSENRSKQTGVKGGVTTITTYVYDANDRLTSETTGSVTTTYTFTGTQLTGKTVSGVTTNYTFNLQGRMSGMTGPATLAFEYDANGNRVSQSVSGTRTDYLLDVLNLTGYSQVFAEKQGATLVNFYAIGTDIVSQYNPTNGVLYFLKDGLNNTRAMLSSTGTVSERYDYDAFGNAIGFTPSGSTKTKLLYCNESFDVNSGFYYLRARYYDPKVGRFNRLDPFFGNLNDPQSLHKYTYCHGDPVNNVDPSGMFLSPGLTLSMSIMGYLRGLSSGTGLSALTFLSYKILGYSIVSITTLVAATEITQGVRAGYYYLTTDNSSWRENQKGLAGEDIINHLRTLQVVLKEKWDTLSSSEKHDLINTFTTLYSPSPDHSWKENALFMHAWDINELTQDTTIGTVNPALPFCPKTVTVAGKSYVAPEVNYFLWGLINRLAYDDGINVTTTSRFAAENWVRMYRFNFYTDQVGTGGINGRTAWTVSGWNAGSSGDILVPCETALPNVTPNSTSYSGSLKIFLGDARNIRTSLSFNLNSTGSVQ